MGYALHEGVPDIVAQCVPRDLRVGASRVSPHGVRADASAIGNGGDRQCGDVIRLYLKIEGGIILDSRIKVFGCPAVIACASVLTEMIKGKTVIEALNITNESISDILGGLPTEKLHCTELAEAVLRDAISGYRENPVEA